MEFFDPHQSLDIDGYWPIFELQKVCQTTHLRNLSPTTSKESAYSTGFSSDPGPRERRRVGEVQLLVSTPIHSLLLLRNNASKFNQTIWIIITYKNL